MCEFKAWWPFWARSILVQWRFNDWIRVFKEFTDLAETPFMSGHSTSSQFYGWKGFFRTSTGHCCLYNFVHQLRDWEGGESRRSDTPTCGPQETLDTGQTSWDQLHNFYIWDSNPWVREDAKVNIARPKDSIQEGSLQWKPVNSKRLNCTKPVNNDMSFGTRCVCVCP
jgi:hypothetical protein